ncbi:MAG: TRAM domain-containing protein [Planctomycetaceae bacterium]
MLLVAIRCLYAIVCIGSILAFVTSGISAGEDPPGLIGSYRFWSFLGLLALTQAVTLVDILIPKKRIEVISAIYFGLLIGFLLSYLFIQALTPAIQNWAYRPVVVLLTSLIVPYLCITLLLQTKDDFRFIIPYVEFSRELKAGKPLVLDSSALIDGRIADVVETNILDAQMIVPQFILHEIQDIADSNDKMRRTRGRRGLEILGKLQNNPKVDIHVHETEKDAPAGKTVDQRLVDCAQELGGRVVTNDFNLNKVASVQGIEVINLNDVANALKPRYIPGERLHLKIIKEGESAGQGVGYLDDGTMVVCEQAGHLVGKEVNSVVTSVLQSSAGRMIFAKLEDDNSTD